MAKRTTWNVLSQPTANAAFTLFTIVDERGKVGAVFHRHDASGLCSGIRFPDDGTPRTFLGNVFDRVLQGIRDDFRNEYIDFVTRMN